MKRVLAILITLSLFTPLASASEDERVCYTVIDPAHGTIKKVCITKN